MTEREMTFAKSIRTLLAKTFVVREKNEKVYNFCRNEANKIEINMYLEKIGYYIAVDSVLGVVQLKNTTELENEMGVRSDNLYSFNALEQLYLMLFRQYYDEHPYEHPVNISRTAFLEQVLSYAPNEKKTTYTNTLRKLKYFNIISYTESKRAIDDFNITILPSIVFAIDEKRLESLLEEFESGVEKSEEDETENIDVDAIAEQNIARMEGASTEEAIESEEKAIPVESDIVEESDDDNHEYDEEKEESDYEPDEDEDDDEDSDDDDDDYDWDAEEDNSEWDDDEEEDEDDDEDDDTIQVIVEPAPDAESD